MSDYKKIAQCLKKGSTPRRFRASIYVDLFIEDEQDYAKEDANEAFQRALTKAKEEASKISEGIPNSYVGGVASYYDDNALSKI